MSDQPDPKWKDGPERHDFPAAAEYMTLTGQGWGKMDQKEGGHDLGTAKGHRAFWVDVIRRRGHTDAYKAKDLLRASGLPLLGPGNLHVARNLGKIKDGVELSPLIVVRPMPDKPGAVIIADGYHRMCAVYLSNEDAEVPVWLL